MYVVARCTVNCTCDCSKVFSFFPQFLLLYWYPPLLDFRGYVYLSTRIVRRVSSVLVLRKKKIRTFYYRRLFKTYLLNYFFYAITTNIQRTHRTREELFRFSSNKITTYEEKKFSSTHSYFNGDDYGNICRDYRRFVYTYGTPCIHRCVANK